MALVEKLAPTSGSSSSARPSIRAMGVRELAVALGEHLGLGLEGGVLLFEQFHFDAVFLFEAVNVGGVQGDVGAFVGGVGLRFEARHPLLVDSRLRVRLFLNLPRRLRRHRLGRNRRRQPVVFLLLGLEFRS